MGGVAVFCTSSSFSLISSRSFGYSSNLFTKPAIYFILMTPNQATVKTDRAYATCTCTWHSYKVLVTSTDTANYKQNAMTKLINVMYLTMVAYQHPWQSSVGVRQYPQSADNNRCEDFRFEYPTTNAETDAKNSLSTAHSTKMANKLLSAERNWTLHRNFLVRKMS